MKQQLMRSFQAIRPLLSKQRFMLVRDRAYDHLEVKSFFDDLDHVEFSDFTPNPLYEQVCHGISLFNRENCSAIVAVGGGSAIDVAKCIKLFCRSDPSTNYLQQQMVDTGIPLIAVPTTAGTGSESTRHAVIYYNGVKQSISHHSIIPDYAILVPSVLSSLPLYQKKCTMMDALCQAIESWWSVNSTPESISYSSEAIQAILSNWEAYIKQNDADAAEAIMLASNLAGKAINITATTAAHAMSYKITSLYGFPHGHAVAVCLPPVWRYLQQHTDDCIDDRGPQHLRDTLQQITALLTLDEYEKLLRSLSLLRPVSEQKKADVALLVRSINPVRLKNTPVALEPSTLEIMYQEIVQE